MISLLNGFSLLEINQLRIWISFILLYFCIHLRPIVGPNLRWQQTVVKRRRKKRLCRKVNEIREFSRVGWSSHFDRLCSGFLSLLPPKALSACLTASAQPCNGALCSSVTYWHKTSFLNMKFSFAVSLTKRHDAWLDTCCLVTILVEWAKK